MIGKWLQGTSGGGWWCFISSPGNWLLGNVCYVMIQLYALRLPEYMLYLQRNAS